MYICNIYDIYIYTQIHIYHVYMIYMNLSLKVVVVKKEMYVKKLTENCNH